MDNPYPNCEKCIFVDEPLDKDPCQECHRAFLAQRIKPNFVSKRKPKTNADRVRAMTDEELASLLMYFADDTDGIDEKDYDAFGNMEWRERMLRWLKQECE